MQDASQVVVCCWNEMCSVKEECCCCSRWVVAVVCGSTIDFSSLSFLPLLDLAVLPLLDPSATYPLGIELFMDHRYFQLLRYVLSY